MARQSRQAAQVPGGTPELLPLAFSRPGEALKKAHAILATDPGPYDACIAHQAIGIVLRDFGDMRLILMEAAPTLTTTRTPEILTPTGAGTASIPASGSPMGAAGPSSTSGRPIPSHKPAC